jgi:hypothetical protein
VEDVVLLSLRQCDKEMIIVPRWRSVIKLSPRIVVVETQPQASAGFVSPQTLNLMTLPAGGGRIAEQKKISNGGGRGQVWPTHKAYATGQQCVGGERQGWKVE